MSNRPEVFYALRYLAPGSSGYGHIVHAISTKSEMSLKDDPKKPEVVNYRTIHPEAFVVPGFYSLMIGTGDTFTVEKKKESS